MVSAGGGMPAMIEPVSRLAREGQPGRPRHAGAGGVGRPAAGQPARLIGEMYFRDNQKKCLRYIKLFDCENFRLLC